VPGAESRRQDANVGDELLASAVFRERHDGGETVPNRLSNPRRVRISRHADDRNSGPRRDDSADRMVGAGVFSVEVYENEIGFELVEEAERLVRRRDLADKPHLLRLGQRSNEIDVARLAEQEKPWNLDVVVVERLMHRFGPDRGGYPVFQGSNF
jgi:hypothetical protein